MQDLVSPMATGSGPIVAEPASWETIEAYAADQVGEAAEGRGPRRTQAVEARYRRYTEWCSSRGHTGVDLILATAIWQAADAGPERHPVRVALEVNIVPYYCEAGISHWVLWYHPDDLPGTADLDPELYLPHLRVFLPALRAADEVLAFQNRPQFRSVPQMAHAHIFLRPRTDATTAALAALRRERLIRSPWAEAERAAGRGDEVHLLRVGFGLGLGSGFDPQRSAARAGGLHRAAASSRVRLRPLRPSIQ